MSGQPVPSTVPVSPAAPAPGRQGRLAVDFFAAQLVVNVAVGGVSQALLPNQMASIAPADKVAAFGLVSGIGSLVGMLGQPLAGALSDRTRSRFGRRAPWLAVGAVGAGALIVGLGLCSSLLLVALCWAVAQVFIAAFSAPLLAVMPDRTPPDKRGLFSGLAGIAVFAGGVVGVGFAARLADRIPFGYSAFGLLLALGGLVFAWRLRERPATHADRPAVSLRTLAKAMWVSPRRHPDFAWAFGARFALFLGYSAILAYQLYIMQDYIGLSRDAANDALSVNTIILAVTTLAGLLPAGILSDRLGRRKPIIMVSSLVIAASAVPPLLSPTLPALTASIALAGLGAGCYLSVDQALMTLLLPRAEDNGKDLGVLNIANAGAQALAPMVASLVIGSAAGYRGLFVMAIVLVTVAAAAIVPIKSAR